MTIYSFGVEAGDVLEKVPIDTSQVGPSTTPVSTGDVEEYILDRSAEAAGLLAKGGLTDEENLDETTERQVALYVRVASALDMLDKMPMSAPEQRSDLSSERGRLYAMLNNPQLLRQRKARSRSNVDENSTATHDFTGDYQY